MYMREQWKHWQMFSDKKYLTWQFFPPPLFVSPPVTLFSKLVSLITHPPHPSTYPLSFNRPKRWSIRKPSWPSDLWRSMRSVLRSSISPSRLWKPGSASWSPVATEPSLHQPFSVTSENNVGLLLHRKEERSLSCFLCVCLWYLFVPWEWTCVSFPQEQHWQQNSVSILETLIGGTELNFCFLSQWLSLTWEGLNHRALTQVTVDIPVMAARSRSFHAQRFSIDIQASAHAYTKPLKHTSMGANRQPEA